MAYTTGYDDNEDIEMLSTYMWYNSVDLMRFVTTAETKDLSLVSSRREILDMFNGLGKMAFARDLRFPGNGRWICEEDSQMEGFSISIRSLNDNRDRNAGNKTGASTAADNQNTVATYSFRNRIAEMRQWIRSQRPGETRASFEARYGLTWS